MYLCVDCLKVNYTGYSTGSYCEKSMRMSLPTLLVNEMWLFSVAVRYLVDKL